MSLLSAHTRLPRPCLWSSITNTETGCLDPKKNIPARLAPSRRDTCRQLRFSWPPCQKCDTPDRSSVICRAANQASGFTGSYAWLSYGNVLGIYGLGPSNLSPYAFVAGPNERECSSSCYRCRDNFNSPSQRQCVALRSFLEWSTLENILVTSGKVLSSSTSNPILTILQSRTGPGTPTTRVTHKWKYHVALYFTIVMCSI